MIHLYIKQHNVTGLKYFGQTRRNPFIYKGSGVRWRKHLEKYGCDIETLSVWSYRKDQYDECCKFAREFSKTYNITNDPNWANLIPETVEQFGRTPGFKLSSETIIKRTATRKRNNKPCTLKGRTISDETREKIRQSCLNKPKSIESISKRTATRLKNKKDHPCKGIPRTQEVKDKIRLSKIGSCHSESTKVKFKIAWIRRKQRAKV